MLLSGRAIGLTNWYNIIQKERGVYWRFVCFTGEECGTFREGTGVEPRTAIQRGTTRGDIFRLRSLFQAGMWSGDFANGERSSVWLAYCGKDWFVK